MDAQADRRRTSLLLAGSIAFWIVLIVVVAALWSNGDEEAHREAPPGLPHDDTPSAPASGAPGFTPLCKGDASRNNALVGINLAGPSDWNTELPFVDEFKLSRKWISQKKGEKWGAGPELALDEHGWVRSLEKGCSAEAPMLTFEEHKPSGLYTILYEGRGDISIARGAAEVSRAPGRVVYRVATDGPGLFLRLTSTSPRDYIRDIRVILPDHEQTHRTAPFRPGFLETWRPLNTFRFMDWMKTNNSRVEQWDDRPKPTDATYTTAGVPLEVMVDLCNRQLVNPWFCIPHKATDEFVRAFAKLVRDSLDPTLHVYVEYSNELWNGMFAQAKYAGDQGTKLGLADKRWEAGWRYTARRSVEILGIWEAVFGSTDRLVRVIATQSANPFVSKQILDFEQAYRHADALAVAPYMSMNVRSTADREQMLYADEVARWSVDRVLAYVENVALAKSARNTKEQAAIAAERGLRLIAYEGGQHLVGVRGGENNEELTALFQQANRHPKMGELYEKYYDAWRATGGDLFCVFSSIGRWSKWGSWGLAEYWDTTPAEAPKLAATLSWTKANRLENAAATITGLDDATVRVGAAHVLAPVIEDDGASRMAVLSAWSSDDPQHVGFTDAGAAQTSVIVSRAGTYEVTLRVSDGFARSNRTITLTAE
jgi:hypothetical protein